MKGSCKMKKALLAIVFSAMLCGLCSCGNSAKVKSSDASVPEVKVETTSSAETETTDSTSETESKETDSTSTDTETTASTVTSAAETSSTPASSVNYSTDSNGAVVLNTPAAEQSDEELMAAAQALFQTACQTAWRFSVGCPYAYDSETYISNDYDWHYYLITDPAITSIADVKADFHTVFSEKYPDNNIDELYIEKDGKVYALDGQRGSNIFYSKSEIISLDSNTGDEMTFTVRNYYNGDDWGEESSTDDRPFSMVKDSDGTWRVGTFNLPY